MATRSGVLTADPRRELRMAAAVIGAVVAFIHLFHPRLGAPRLIEYMELGQLYHPLPLLFTLSAALMVFGIVLGYYGLLLRAVYVSGILLMAGYVFGYMAWHTALDHGALWPTLQGATHEQPNPLVLLWLHVSEDPLGVVTKILEVMLAAVLGMLLLIDRPLSHEGERPNAEKAEE